MLTEFLSNEELCFQPRWMLGNKNGENLTGIFRSKQGRMRFLYIGKHGAWTTLLMIGRRKAGDKSDAYRELAKRLRTTEWDEVFRELGLKKPKP